MAMSIYGAVLEYVTGKSEIEIPFPAKDIRCSNCWFCQNDTTCHGRKVCTHPTLKWKILFCPDLGIHEDCPLEFKTKEMK